MRSKHAVLITGAALLLMSLSSVRGVETQIVEGVWAYESLTPKGRQPYSLTGLFVFKDGLFVQHAINDGDPLDQQGGQAHYGTYQATPEGIRLRADVGIGVSPDRPRILSVRRDAEHQISPSIKGDRLILTFGSGTVQTLRRLGSGEGRILRLDQGMLALLDGHFARVAALSDEEVVAGSGQYEQRADDRVRFNTWRWFSASQSRAENVRDRIVEVRFDGKVLELPDGRRLQVTQ
jgi:hypothetical protein